ncbi:MAG TPA: radical SAM family heme chaperone HemW [Candidatus Binatia bacterium]|nr:radical SAM family heme chaperone HemW [Candidatus Binatia bacterium]
MATPVALYVHVPWCRHVCPYCDFNVHATTAAPEADDVPALIAELAAHTSQPAWAGRPAATVYFGGGTPSLLSPAAIAALLDAIRSRCGTTDDVEVTLEANPGTVDRERLDGYRRAGVNRLSLGTQSFRADVLRTLGRDHAAGDTATAVAAARAAGFASISLDLIFAVPGQTLAAWDDDLASAVALAPEHVSTYSLTYEEGTPFHRWRTSGRVEPIDDDTESLMADAAAERLAAAGLVRYEISSWARPGHASRHNTRYWDGSDYLGLGAGAHSFCATPFPGRRWMNVRHPSQWRAAVTADGTAIATEESLDVAVARGEFVMTGLRRIAGVDLAAFAARFGVSLDVAFPHTVGLERDGLLERADGRLRLAPQGLRFADTVSATYL